MCLLVASSWKEYARCRDPLNVWLVVDFGALILFRIVQFCVQALYRWRLPRQACCLATANLYVVYTFMWLWAATGSVWYARSGSCLHKAPSSGWWFLAWLVYTYVYLAAFAALLMSFWRVQQSSLRFNSIADLQRILNEYMQAEALGMQVERRGLTTAAIEAIPSRVVTERDVEVSGDEWTCAVCLNAIKGGQTVRVLPCPHFFHQECIDQWLRVRPNCPMCREPVVSGASLAVANEATRLLPSGDEKTGDQKTSDQKTELYLPQGRYSSMGVAAGAGAVPAVVPMSNRAADRV